MPENKKYLSASRIKTFESCSWLYWCQYHLKIPQEGNSGMWMGSVCHLVLELLLLPKHKQHYDLITEAKTIEASKAVQRLVIKHLKIYGINNDEFFEMVDKMLVIGLNQDFFVEGSKLLEPEIEFDIENEDPKYRIYGFIDKAAQFKKDKKIVISDYKSSKKKFSGEGLDSNVQALMYSLVAKKMWPKLKPVVEFIFLRFPRAPIQKLEFSDETLKGFEYYLEAVFKRVCQFSEENAKSNFAATKPKPSDGGWGGCLNCGFAKYEGQLKKDGSPMWHCPYKFGFSYYALKNEKGEVVKTNLENIFAPEEDQKVVRMKYKGCPHFS
jgi:ATP-dependent helicase/DNAse subunit B